MTASKRGIRAGCGRIVREMQRDLRRMERIQRDVRWLNTRDSNTSSAASMTDAIAVLIAEALRTHRLELKDYEYTARTGRLKKTESTRSNS